MSTGARDQLYLALRLAYLEDYASRAEPAPFIGDDLFASFDEDRTFKGLAALAAMGDRVQPIVFTGPPKRYRTVPWRVTFQVTFHRWPPQASRPLKRFLPP
jgi:uncharacterized protein YhaN